MRFNRFVLESTLATLAAATRSDEAVWASVPAHLHLFETVASTNQTAWEQLQQEETTIVIALQQTAGRGQRGHQWSSPKGGLYLSLGLTPNLSADCGIHLTLCSAWGIASALRQHNIPVEIKWLNDLVINQRKLGGILTETRVTHQHIRQAVIGVGINWQNPVPPLGINLHSVLTDSNSPLQSLEGLAAVVIFGLLKGYNDYRHQGIEPLLSSYQSLLTSLGQEITINGVTGKVTGISPEGELQVRLEAESEAATVRIRPGELSLGYG
jgi:BirA family transcriptional regulator, biotin operon repressor / biotin---[acetyl-CoA-carboxylase] ligase